MAISVYSSPGRSILTFDQKEIFVNAVASIAEVRKRKERKARLHTWARVKEPVWFSSFRLLMAYFPLLKFPIDPCIRRAGYITEVETTSDSGEVMYKMLFAAAGKNNTPIIRSYPEEDLEFLGPR